MSAISATPPSIAIWERAIQPSKKSLDASAARALLGIKMSKRDLDRADVLAAKAAKGALSAKEAEELENYRSVGTALEFLKSKARRSLKAA
ncbi:MAG: hypothetical protein V4662_22090 [Verrucomicrobiota bacterium]